MKKRLLNIFILSFVMCLTAMCFLVNANAASASLWFTDPTVTVGSNVSVVVDVKGDDIGGYEMNVSYDTTYLQFVSASSSSGNFSHVHNTGVIRIVDYMSSGSASKMSCTLTFKTKKTGTTKLIPSGYNFTSGGADDIAPYAIGDSTINIIPVPQASSDATLKSLAISNGTLNPAFSPSVTQYIAEVDFSVTSLAVTALKNHNGASVYVGGNESLAVGENTVSVTVTAENGAKQTYTIKVTRGKNPLSSDIFLKVGEGITAEISMTISTESIPKGFELTQIVINNITVNAIIYDERALPAVYLLGNDSVAEGLYYVDVENMTAKPFEYLGQPTSSLLLLDINMAIPPMDYEIGKFTVSGVERDALIPMRDETPNHCLVYAVGAMGEKTLYMYDPVENTFQRYSFAEMGEPETTVPDESTGVETTPETSKQNENKNENNKQNNGLFSNQTFKWIFVGIAVLIVALTVVAIILGLKRY